MKRDVGCLELELFSGLSKSKSRTSWPFQGEEKPMDPIAGATIPCMDDTGIGFRVVVTDARTLGAIGIAHVPGPVRPDDLIAFREGIHTACLRSFLWLPAQPCASSPIRLRSRIAAR